MKAEAHKQNILNSVFSFKNKLTNESSFAFLDSKVMSIDIGL